MPQSSRAVVKRQRSHRIRFVEVFLGTLRRYASSENRDDPEHNSLIGLAYLDGIDVEIIEPGFPTPEGTNKTADPEISGSAVVHLTVM